MKNYIEYDSVNFNNEITINAKDMNIFEVKDSKLNSTFSNLKIYAENTDSKIDNKLKANDDILKIFHMSNPELKLNINRYRNIPNIDLSSNIERYRNVPNIDLSSNIERYRNVPNIDLSSNIERYRNNPNLKLIIN